MRTTIVAALVISIAGWLIPRDLASGAENAAANSSPRKQNNLVSELLSVGSISKPGKSFTFTRPRAGWIFVAADCQGAGRIKIAIDSPDDAELIARDALQKDGGEKSTQEAVRWVSQGEHRLTVDCEGDAAVDRLVVKSIPELMHCGLGFNSSIKGYGLYDLDFLKRDILPNVTTLVVPGNIQLPRQVIDDWHRQGKRFVAEVGLDGQAKTPEEYAANWTGHYDKAPLLDGILINEFIVNSESTRAGRPLSPERQKRADEEREKYKVYEAAIKKIHLDNRYPDKTLYAYVGGNGKKLNTETIGSSFIHTLIECGDRIALERYIHEMSCEQGSKEALKLFIEGIEDWSAKEPSVKPQMVIAFGLFSMPPGGINKQPNVDYHVWMDQQMNLVANNPALTDIGGLEWWTSILADEETVRFVGQLYRHYGLEGKTDMLTHDPLFLTHVTNADFEQGRADWTLHAAEEGSIEAKSFPRYGRIEGRYMGLGRPADPEHIGDRFLWMKRSSKGPNSFSQTIKNLQPGRLYSLKMFSCDYQDLMNPKAKSIDQTAPFIGRVELEGVELDTKRSFTEMYASNPEPPIPVWITYFWKVFRAKSTTATLTVSDWPNDHEAKEPFGQEQTFNFVEVQPYHE